MSAVVSQATANGPQLQHRAFYGPTTEGDDMHALLIWQAMRRAPLRGGDAARY